MRIILATGNAHKVGEFATLALESKLPVRFESARAHGGMPEVIEDTGTFEGNATKKARALWEKLGRGEWVLSDDSGLCVDALGGEPGVESAYYAGPQGDPKANLEKLVSVLRAVPDGSRGAYFVCVLCLVSPSGDVQLFRGEARGTLLREPRGGAGFGYDPLLVPEGTDKTYAELGEAEKNAISHRGRAFAELAKHLRAITS